MKPDEKQLQELLVSLMRDIFAAGACAGIMAGAGDAETVPGRVAEAAYEQADAMLMLSATPAILQEIQETKK